MVVRMLPGQVIKEFQVSRASLYRDLKNGKITAETDERGQRVIDAAEAARVYEQRQAELSQSEGEGVSETLEAAIETALLQQQNQFLEEKLAERDRQLEERRTDIATLNSRLDTAEREKAQLTRLLTDQRPYRPWWRFWAPDTPLHSPEAVS